MESLGGLVSRTPLEHSGRLNLTCNCESQKSQARVSLLAKFNVSSDSTLAKASERRVRGWGPPAQFHVEHQERRTSGLIWWGRLGDDSRFEPTKTGADNDYAKGPQNIRGYAMGAGGLWFGDPKPNSTHDVDRCEKTWHQKEQPMVPPAATSS